MTKVLFSENESQEKPFQFGNRWKNARICPFPQENSEQASHKAMK